MDWIKGIQKAIDYTESHISEEIDYDAVAKEAYSSSFHFQSEFVQRTVSQIPWRTNILLLDRLKDIESGQGMQRKQ